MDLISSALEGQNVSETDLQKMLPQASRRVFERLYPKLATEPARPEKRNGGRNGLLSGEAHYLHVKRMEMANQDNKHYIRATPRYGLEHSLSLR